MLHAIGEGHEQDLLRSSAIDRRLLRPDGGIDDQVADDVVERCASPRLEPGPVERADLRYRQGVDQDFVGVLAVELHQGHDGQIDDPAPFTTCQDSEGSTFSWKSRSGVRSNG